MDFVQILMVFGVVAGMVLVIVSFFGGEKDRDEPLTARPPSGELFLEKRLEAIDTTLSEADSAIAELGGISKNVFKEIDLKYNELLFLYNLIDEKKKEIETVTTAAPLAYSMPEAALEPKEDIALTPSGDAPAYSAIAGRAGRDPRFSRIVELKKSGLNIGQIAKELDMGQGEVSLIMTLLGPGA